MAILFSSEFCISENQLNKLGVFNPFIDEDSHFFINITRLRTTTVPEFASSYAKVNQYFYDIGLLLKASKTSNDRMYREALRRFDFPEVNGINLGFSSGKHGAGFGLSLRKAIVQDAFTIIKSGSEQPEIFHLVGLFEENVGPDRLSDMVARIIYTDIVAYSRRMYHLLGIKAENYPEYSFRDGVIINPYKHVPLLLLPEDILHELPIAQGWDDINRVCRENDAIRAEINDLIGDEWQKLRASERKRYLFDWVFLNPERTERVVNSYRTVSTSQFNPLSDPDYLARYLVNTYSVNSEGGDTSFDAAMEIMQNYREWVESHRGSMIIQGINSRTREKAVQCTIHAIALIFCKKFSWDISPETDCGRGPEDFKISRGTDKCVVEVKLSSNAQCVHGLEVQIEEYAKAECTDNKIYVLVNTGAGEKRIDAVLKKREEMLKNGLNPAHVIIIDARGKDSASVYNPQL